MTHHRDKRLDWDRPASGYTIEGQLEDVGDFARGMRRHKTWVKVVASLVLAALLIPVVAAAVQLLG